MKIFFLALILTQSLPAYSNIGDNILQNYKKNFNKLSPIQKEHFSLRMYSMTGDKKYLNQIKPYVFTLSSQLNYLIDNLYVEQFIELENSKLMNISDLGSEKQIQRIRIISKKTNLAFNLNFLVLLYKMHFYSLEKTVLIKNPNFGILYIKSKTSQLTKFILDKDNIKIYGAQLINYVYYLIELDIIDIREQYTELFKKTFPNNKDKKLSNALFSSKIYGLTHFILAASNYYQHPPSDSKQFDWIIDYFDKNIDRIINKTENDVIVEVGVCYQLLNKTHLNSFKRIKSYLHIAYDSKHNLLPNKKKSYDLIQGEHRNILLIMFLKWPKKLNHLPKFFYQSDITTLSKKYNHNVDYFRLIA